jgi:hypothetical protein
VGPVPPVRRAGFVGRAAAVLLVLAVVAVGVFVVLRLTMKHPVCGPDLPNPDSTFVARDSLGKGEVLAGALARWCLPQERINDVYSSLAKTDFNFRNMAAGDRVTLTYRGLNLADVTYSKDPVTSFKVSFDSAGTSAVKETKRVDTARVVVRGAIKGSLWNSMIELGEAPALIVNFAEVLGYEVDFLTEVNPGGVCGALQGAGGQLLRFPLPESVRSYGLLQREGAVVAQERAPLAVDVCQRYFEFREAVPPDKPCLSTAPGR